MEPHPYRQAFAARDLDRLLSLFTDDVTYHTPFVSDPGFEGRASVAAIMRIAMDVLEDGDYTHDLGDERSHVLIANFRVVDEQVKITTLLEYDTEGKIREFWFMVRPLKGIIALAGAVGRAVESLEPALLELSKPLADLAGMFERAGARQIIELNGSAA